MTGLLAECLPDLNHDHLSDQLAHWLADWLEETQGDWLADQFLTRLVEGEWLTSWLAGLLADWLPVCNTKETLYECLEEMQAE